MTSPTASSMERGCCSDNGGVLRARLAHCESDGLEVETTGEEMNEEMLGESGMESERKSAC